MLESRKKIEIPLRAASGVQQKRLKTNIRSTVENEYAHRYLESIGVHATKDKVEYMLSNMPVERALVVPVWTRSALILVPERVEEKDQNVIKQIYTGTKDIEISKRKLVSFFGKGVSEPGTKPPQHQDRPKTSDRERKKERPLHPEVALNFPLPSKLPLIEIESPPFRQMIKPLAVNDGRVKMAVKSFCASLADFVPRIFEDNTGRVNVSIQKFLSCLMCRRLFGLLCHYVFWNIVHPFVRQALVAAKAQQGHLMDKRHHQEEACENLETQAFIRRKSMMNFSSPDFKSIMGLATLTQEPETTPTGRSVRPSIILDRATKRIINASRAVTMFGGHALSRSNSVDKGGGEAVVESGPSLADLTLSSETSLTSEEKEMLYLQLEQCLNKLHTQMGCNRHALINARESLVAGCHYIVNEIMQAHYTWLGGKREAMSIDAHSLPQTPASSQGSRRGGGVTFGIGAVVEKVAPLSSEELKNIDAVRKAVLKQVNKTLTELLDPARVYCDKIMREMFVEEDVAVENSPDLLGHSRVPVDNSKKASGDSSYYATSIAVRAVLSESQSHETRRFLKMNTHGTQPYLKAKYKSRAEQSLTGEPSVFTTGTGSIMSFEDSGEIRASGEFGSTSRPDTGNSLHEASSPIPSRIPPTGMGNFKSLFATDMKIHPSEMTSNASTFNPKHSILYKRSESVDQSIRESKLMESRPNSSGQLHMTARSRPGSPQVLTRMNSTAPDFLHPPLHSTAKKNKKEAHAEALLSADTKGKLMSLIVERTKSKYQDNLVLQFSRAPNARYRRDLLSKDPSGS